MSEMRRVKIYEENGGYIVMTREGGSYYREDVPKNVFADLDKALQFIKDYMTQEIDEKPKKKARKKKTKVAPH